MRPARGLEAKDEAERVVDRADLTGIQSPSGPTESLRIYHGRLFGQYAGLGAVEFDDGPEAGGAGARGRRCHQDGTEAEQLIGLDDDGVASAALLATARRVGGGQAEDLAADHG